MRSKLWMTLKVLVVIATIGAVVACAAPTPQVIEKEVVVEKVVKETVEVEREVVVEKEKVAEPVNIILWTKEGEADGGLQFVESLANEYSNLHPHVSFEIVNKDVEALREDFLTAGLAGSLPDLLWTVSDHAGPFTDAELIMPVDDLFALDKYVGSALAGVELKGSTWGVPVANGNHLMLIYNKDIIEEPPTTTDELIEMGQELSTGDQYALVYNQTEPFWLVPWLGGFGGAVFAEDGTTPTLDTPAMVATLQFLYDIKYTTPIVPMESDYNGADTIFKEGKAAMIINGDWSLGGYKEAVNIGVARIPQVSGKEWPHPYTSGVYFMFPETLEGAKLEAVKGFVDFVTSANNQALMIAKLNRLPGLKAALEDPLIANDPVLKGSADQMVVGVPMPTVSEMRCNWDAMKPEMLSVLADSKSPEDAAAAMQEAAETCIEGLE